MRKIGESRKRTLIAACAALIIVVATGLYSKQLRAWYVLLTRFERLSDSLEATDSTSTPTPVSPSFCKT